MNDAERIEKTIAFVKNELKGAEGGHDWFHIERVFRNTLQIARTEKVNLRIVSLAALLHDIADPKFHQGDERLGPKKAGDFLKTLKIPKKDIDHILNIIRFMSFKNSLPQAKEDSGKNPKKGEQKRKTKKSKSNFESPELHVVRDADRLDAIGAIGIARAFNYGGHKGRKLYDPNIPPRPNLTKEEYKKSGGPSINHFYEKLLLLKDGMHTQAARELAESRHNYMLEFLEQFYAEWNGRA